MDIKKTMFGDLDLFEEENFFQEHKTGNLFFDKKDHKLEFFAFLHTNAYDEMLYRTGEWEEGEKQAYLEYVRQKAIQYREIHVSTTDHIVILSTCQSSGTNGRTILAARLKEEAF